jgi:dolichol-phosphate mannosyltransferase
MHHHAGCETHPAIRFSRPERRAAHDLRPATTDEGRRMTTTDNDRRDERLRREQSELEAVFAARAPTASLAELEEVLDGLRTTREALQSPDTGSRFTGCAAVTKRRLSSDASITETATDGPVWVCIPTYDEAENVVPLVTSVVDELARAGLDGRVLVIDDDSPDGTGELAEEVARRDARVSVLHRTGKQGIGPAYRAGFRHALDAGAETVVEMDCDFSHDPAALPALVSATAGADLAIGSRYVDGGAISRWGLARRAISRAGCWYARTVLGLRVRDLTGGFKCFRRPVLERIAAGEGAAAGYGFQIETTYRAVEAGFDVVEVPIEFTDRSAGESKMSWRIALEAAVLVLRLRLARRRA